MNRVLRYAVRGQLKKETIARSDKCREENIRELGPPRASLVAQRLKHLPAMWETCV